MKLSHITKKSKRLVIAGVGLAILAVSTSACSTQATPKDELLSRFEETATASKLTQDYKVSFDVKTETIYDSFLSDLSISGQSTTDGKNVELTANVDGLEGTGFALKGAHFVVYDEAMYLNTEVIFDFFAQQYGLDLKSESKGEYIKFSDVVDGISSGSEYSEYSEKFGASTELNKEIFKAIKEYFATLEKDKFVKDDKTGYISLKLENKELKEVWKRILKVLSESKNYTGDDQDSIKETLKTFDKDFDELSKTIEMSVTFGQGEKLGDSKMSISYSSDEYGKGVVTLETTGKDYKAPKKPDTIISYEEFQKQLEKVLLGQ
ncbi:hypothetical protein [Streptococcus suis]